MRFSINFFHCIFDNPKRCKLKRFKYTVSIRGHPFKIELQSVLLKSIFNRLVDLAYMDRKNLNGLFIDSKIIFSLTLVVSFVFFLLCHSIAQSIYWAHIHNIGTELIKSMINRHSAPELCIFLDHVVYANFWGLNWKLGTDLIFIWVLFGGMRWTIVSICISLLCMLYF